ncbi:MAG: flavin reductase [Phycisphaera sp.]|nr:flavin reductase [Phycisphaera sp.]
MRIIEQDGLDDPPHREVVHRMPTGRYLLTAAHGGARRGLLVSRIQHCADEPPTVLVSVRKGHALSPLIRDAACFGLCELSVGDRILSRLFSKPTELQDDDPFLGHQLIAHSTGNAPIPACSASWMSCELLRHLDIEADFEIYIGRILASGVLSGGERTPDLPEKSIGPGGRPGIDNAPRPNGNGKAKRPKRASA